ncbi:DUF1127 domain-containing protein [Pseudooceanicola sp. MF1-13]|uniref:DUF1127 domain-containing protein n=1 Tax=Pseudooceanicola sp. MF1-13 TaxID=3379095 RepID=UPI003891C1B8
MSIYVMTPRAQTGFAVSIGHIGRFVSNLHLSVRDWNDRRQTRRLLNALSDRELYDIGLTRAEIEGLS